MSKQRGQGQRGGGARLNRVLNSPSIVWAWLPSISHRWGGASSTELGLPALVPPVPIAGHAMAPSASCSRRCR
ncbi:MAG: hypothetical protein M3Y19_00915 [Actinomycetota bacterium]|nr:hypothetical protein [Actinomycetota bacterium]